MTRCHGPWVDDAGPHRCVRHDPTQIVCVTRTGQVIAFVWLSGCVGTNPYWDGPSGEAAGAPLVDEDGIADDSSGGESDGDSTDETSAFDAGSDGGTTDDTTDQPEPRCAEEEAFCGEACTEIWKDKHACGAECIDCTALYGNPARCTDGVCEPRED